jgi:hypothetical protein
VLFSKPISASFYHLAKADRSTFPVPRSTPPRQNHPILSPFSDFQKPRDKIPAPYFVEQTRSRAIQLQRQKDDPAANGIHSVPSPTAGAAAPSMQPLSELAARTMTMHDPKTSFAPLRLGVRTFPLCVSAPLRDLLLNPHSARTLPAAAGIPHALPPLAARARKSHSTFARSAPIADLTIRRQSRPPNPTIYGTFTKTLSPRNRPLHASKRAKDITAQH